MIYIHATVSDGRKQAIESFGAEVVITPTDVPADSPESYYSTARRIAAASSGPASPHALGIGYERGRWAGLLVAGLGLWLADPPMVWAQDLYIYPNQGQSQEQLDKDKKNNTVTGKHVYMHDSSGNIVNVQDDKLVVLHGLEDYIVVQNDNIILVCRLQEEQKIKQFVNEIKAELGDDML